MRYARSLARAALAAVALLACAGASAVAQSSPRALVYCPVGIDTSGCDNIVAALGGAGSAFSGGVDRGWDGTSGTVDLASADLTGYAVVVVPSLADGADGRPYDRLRGATVAGRLRAAITGRQAIWSGTPDLGTAGVAEKTTLLQSLTAWAAGASGTGLVALLDGSDSTAQRYDWVAGISALAVVADSTPGSYAAVLPLTATGTAIVAPGGQALAYTNMAAFGLHAGSGTSQDAADSASATPVLVTTSGAAPAATTTPVPTGLRALVYCPAADAVGCDNIVAALTATGSPFPGGADRGYDGSTGTLDLRTADLSAYGVFVVPSLADGAAGQPYAVLRDPTVAGRLKPLLAGPVAVWSGTPDLGDSSRAQKNILITNLAKWAMAAQATTGAHGLVALQDASDSVPMRYGWLSLISRASLAADTTLDVYSNVQALTATAVSLLNDGTGLQLGYTNMASFGLLPGAGLGVDATGGRTSSIVLATSSSVGGAGGTIAIVTTDKEDYQPGDTVTVTGAGWQAGETVSLLFHEDVSPPIHPDKTLTAAADANGRIFNHQYLMEATDAGVRFTLTATGLTSGRTAQATFTDAPGVDLAITKTHSGNFTVGSNGSYSITVSNTSNTNSSGTITVKDTLPATLTFVSATGTNWTCPAPVGQIVTCTTTQVVLQKTMGVNGTSSVITLTMTPTAAGTVTNRATVSGGGEAPGNVGSENTASDPTTIKQNQTITFTSTAPGSAVVGGPTYTAAATASSGLTVTFSSLTSGVCTSSGTNGATITMVAVGTCIVAADQAGNATFNPAPQVTQSFSVGKGSQTIAFTSTAPTNAVVGGPTYTAAATGGASGNPVVFSSLTTGVCTSSGTNGATITMVAAGTCTVAANQAGNANYNAATQVTQSFTVGKGSQTITFTSTAPTNAVVGGPTYTVTATGGASGNAVVFSSLTTGVCTSSGTNGATITMVAAGTCTVAADQAGNANYNSAPQVTQPFSVGKANQTITFNLSTLPAKTFGDADFSVASFASASSGLPVSFSSGSPTRCTVTAAGVVHILTAGGNCMVTASQAGNATYNAAPDVQQTFNVAKATPTFSNLSSPTIAFGAANTTLSGTIGAPGPVFASGSTVAITLNAVTQQSTTIDASGNFSSLFSTGALSAAGSPFTVSYAFTANSDFNAASGTSSLVVNKATPTVAVTGGTFTYDGTSHAASAAVTGVGGANLTTPAVTFTYALRPGGTPGSTPPTNAGTYDVVGTFPGDANYNQATGNGTLTIAPRGLTITANNRTKAYGDAVTFAGTEFTSLGLVSGDAVASVTLTSAGAAATASVAGSPYDITASAATGTGLGNYTISYLVGHLTVTAKALTITATNRSKAYGDAVTFAGTEFTSSGLVNSDAVASVTLASTGAAATAAVTAPGPTYAIVASAAVGTGLGNYSISYHDGTLTVTPRPLNITANSASKLYGNVLSFTGSEFGTGAGELVNSDAVTSVTLTSTGAAATATFIAPGPTYAIVASAAVGTGLGNYAISYHDGTLTLTPRPLNITATSRSKTYGDVATFTGSEFGTGVGELVNGSTVTSVTLTSTGATATAAVTAPGPTYAIVASAAVGTGLGNYSISYHDGTLTLTPRPLNITATSRSKSYGDVATFTGSEFGTGIGELVNGNTVTSVTLTSTGAAATATFIAPGPTYPIVASAAVGTGLGNYSISYHDGTLTLTPRPLNITATSRSKSYGDVATFTGSEFGTGAGELVNGDGVTTVTLASTGAAATATFIAPGPTYAIAASAAVGTGLGNYSISYHDGTLTLTPRPLNITANNRSKTYGDALTFAGTEFAAGVGELVNGDGVTTVTLASAGAAGTATVAAPGPTYAIVASAAVGTGLGNYSISYHDGTLTLTPRPLNITATSRSKSYGDVATFTGSEFGTGIGELVNGNTVTSVTLTSTGAAATATFIAPGPTYPIVASAAVGTGLGNYSISYHDGTLTLTPRPLNITATSRSKSYGDVATFTGSEFATGVGELVNGNTVTSVTLTSTGAAATATFVAPGPTYAIVASAAVGSGLGNYTINYHDGTLTLTPRPLNVTANSASKVYGNVLSFTGSEFGTGVGELVNSDAVASVTLASAGAAATATFIAPGPTYAIVASAAVGTGLGNYSISYHDGTLTLTPRPLNITATSRSKSYGDVATFTGSEFGTGVGELVNSDAVTSVTLASAGAAATATFIAPGPTYAIVASAAVGTGLGNYAISYHDGTLTLTPRPLNITANSASKVYGNVLSFTGSEFGTGVGELVNGDVVNNVTLASAGAAATATFIAPGPTYAIVASAAVGTGLGNYSISYHDGTLTLTPRPLNITANSTSKAYGNTLSFAGTEFGTGIGELVNGNTVTGVTLASTGAAGTATFIAPGPSYAIVASAAVGTGLGNYSISYHDGTLTLTPRPLNITANSRSKTYGDVATFVGSEFATGVGELVNGDGVTTVTLASTGSAATATFIAPGPTYAIVASAAVGTGLGNYSISYHDGTLTLTPRPLNITANSASKVYGNVLSFTGAEFGTGIGELVNSNTVTGVTLASAGAAGTATFIAPGPSYAIVASAAVGTGLGNYAISYHDGTLTLTPRPLNITANSASKVYGNVLSFTGAEFAAGVGELVNGNAVTGVTLTSAGAAGTATVAAPGPTYPIVASAAVGSGLGNYTISYHDGTLTLTPRLLTATANSTSRQYSDPNPAFTASYAGFVAPDGPSLVTGTPNLTTTATAATGLGTYAIMWGTSPGVTAGPNYTITTANGTLTVTPEDARADYSGNTIFWTSSATSTSATVTLWATIRDITAVLGDPAYDPNAGDITNAKVSFVQRTVTGDLAIPGCSNLTVGLVNLSDPKTGSVSCTNSTTFTASSSGASQYTIGIIVNGYYTRNSSTDNTVIDVAQPIPSNFITGGGFLVMSSSSSAGQLAGTPGLKNNFGFNVKYNKQGTNLQGNMTIIDRSGGHVYQIKVNSMTSLGVQYCQVTPTGPVCSQTPPSGCTTTATATCPIRANFVSKANIQDITDPANPISMDGTGSSTLQVTMTDMGEPGSSDSIGITVWNKAGGLWFSSEWDGTKTIEKTLAGGNLVDH